MREKSGGEAGEGRDDVSEERERRNNTSVRNEERRMRIIAPICGELGCRLEARAEGGRERCVKNVPLCGICEMAM